MPFYFDKSMNKRQQNYVTNTSACRVPHAHTGRQQSKMLLTIDKCGSKIARNSVFDCHLSSVWQQMAIKTSVSKDFLSTFVDSINVFDCSLSGVILLCPKFLFF